MLNCVSNNKRHKINFHTFFHHVAYKKMIKSVSETKQNFYIGNKVSHVRITLQTRNAAKFQKLSTLSVHFACKTHKLETIVSQSEI